MTTLDVLLIESRPDAGASAAADLEAAGHHVLRCHEPGAPAFPCAALVEGSSCPVDDGVDVALLVRPVIAPRPSAKEEGATCAIRAGLPIVEQGSDVLDPFDTWVTTRVRHDGDVVPACEGALDAGDDLLQRHVVKRIAGVLERSGLGTDDATARVIHADRTMEVHLQLRATPDARRDHALTVRAFDAVRSIRPRRTAQTRVYVHHSPAT